jgi:hypothetical protein
MQARRAKLFIVTGFAFCAAITRAADGPASYGAVDPASVRCELLLRMQDRAPRGTELQFYTWAQGYFAGRGALPPLAAAGAERERHFAQLLRYCGEHLDATFRDAVEELERRLSRPGPAPAGGP